MSDEYSPGEFTDVQPIAGMKAWACSYDGPSGGRFAITLYGTDQKQVIEDNCAELPGLSVDGELVSVAPAVKRKGGPDHE